MCRVGTCTRVAPTVQQRQPRAVVKEAEGYHRRAGAVAGVASACASKRSSASGGLGLATLRRTRGKACISPQRRPAMPHGANGPTRHKEAFSKHLQAYQRPNAFALRLHVQTHWFCGRYMRDLAPFRLYFFHTKLDGYARKGPKKYQNFFFSTPKPNQIVVFYGSKGSIGFGVLDLKKY